MEPTRSSVLLARIGAAHGVRGEVRVKAFTADPVALGGYGPLRADDGRTFVVDRLKPAREVVIVKFRGVDGREAAERLNGVELFVSRDRLPAVDEDEFYHADLIGLAAVDSAGAPLGTVVALHDFGAGDMLEIAPPQGVSLLIPFTQAAVPSIEIAAGRIVVDMPDDSQDAAMEDSA